MTYDPLQFNSALPGNSNPTTVTTAPGVHPLDALGDTLYTISNAFAGPQNAVQGYVGSSGIANSTPQYGMRPVDFSVPTNTPSSVAPSVPGASPTTTVQPRTNIPTGTPTYVAPTPEQQRANVIRDAGLTPEQIANMNAGISSVPTPGSLSSLMNKETPEQIADRIRMENAQRQLEGLSTADTNPDSVYAANLKRVQADIDAANQIYQDQLTRSRITNAPTYQARLDQNRISQIMGGLASGPMGASQTTSIEKANATEQAAQEAILQDRRDASIAALRHEVRTSAAAELAANREAASKGADAIISNYAQRQEKRKVLNTTLAKKALSLNVDLSQMTEEEIAKALGIDTTSAADVKSEYMTGAKAAKEAAVKNEAAQEKAAAELAQTNADTAYKTAQTGQIGKLSPKDSAQLAVEWYKAKNPTIHASDKKLELVSGIGTLLTRSEILPDGTKTNTVPGSDSIPYIDNNGYITPEGWKTVSKEAISGGLSRQDLLEKWGNQLFPGNLKAYGLDPREIKYVETIVPTNG